MCGSSLVLKWGEQTPFKFWKYLKECKNRKLLCFYYMLLRMVVLLAGWIYFIQFCIWILLVVVVVVLNRWNRCLILDSLCPLNCLHFWVPLLQINSRAKYSRRGHCSWIRREKDNRWVIVVELEHFSLEKKTAAGASLLNQWQGHSSKLLFLHFMMYVWVSW